MMPGVFNVKIVEASIRDVTTALSTEDKVDVLLHALEKLGSKSTIRNAKGLVENAVQSCLRISTLSPEHQVKAWALRGRSRLANGSTLAAYQDFQDVLRIDPENKEALSLTRGKALLHVETAANVQASPMLDSVAKLSPEVWREIALFLPRRDLRTLLQVPSSLSRVSSQLLFRTIDLHLSGHSEEDDDYGHGTGKDTDAWHARRSADILARVITDRGFAALVRSLKIYAPPHEMAFLTGVLSNALPKFVNLKSLHCTAGSEVMLPLLQTVEQSLPRLRSLSLEWIGGSEDIGTLNFKHLTHFSFTSSRVDVPPTQAQQFIAQNQTTLRSIRLRHPLLAFPSDSMAIRNITHLEFYGQFSPQSQSIATILANGRQIESLSLDCLLLQCTPSAQFRVYPQGLPFLRHFAFKVSGVHRVNDRDLFPAITEFLRGRTELRTLSLLVQDEPDVQKVVGFDSSTWGVLPSLPGLKTLHISYPVDLAPGLAAWLIPRGVQALNLDWGMLSVRDPSSQLQQLRVGIPPSLRFIGIDVGVRSVDALVEQGFPMVRVARVQQRFWTIVRRQDGSIVKTEPWSARRARYHAAEWLEWFGCDNALWRHTDFQ